MNPNNIKNNQFINDFKTTSKDLFRDNLININKLNHNHINNSPIRRLNKNNINNNTDLSI
jgi:hypothetical protein